METRSAILAIIIPLCQVMHKAVNDAVYGITLDWTKSTIGSVFHALIRISCTEKRLSRHESCHAGVDLCREQM